LFSASKNEVVHGQLSTVSCSRVVYVGLLFQNLRIKSQTRVAA